MTTPASTARQPALAAELLELATAEEQAVQAFTRRALDDDAFGAVVRAHLGWHPADDPIELWRRAGRAPMVPWLATWGDDAEPETIALKDAVGRGTERLGRILDTHGWPGRSLVGEDGADGAWMLAMHADGDRALQQRSIDLLRAAVEVGEADPRHCATLVDRVASTHEGRQHYGTLVFPLPDGPHPLVPVHDGEHLDARRRRLGLPALADDVREPPGQLPYRHLRRSPAFQWPSRPDQPGTAPGVT